MKCTYLRYITNSRWNVFPNSWMHAGAGQSSVSKVSFVMFTCAQSYPAAKVTMDLRSGFYFSVTPFTFYYPISEIALKVGNRDCQPANKGAIFALYLVVDLWLLWTCIQPENNPCYTPTHISPRTHRTPTHHPHSAFPPLPLVASSRMF